MVFICSPYAGCIKGNVQNARQYSIPMQDWFFRGFFDDIAPDLKYVQPLPDKPGFLLAQFFKGLGLGILANIPIFESALWINWYKVLYLGFIVTGFGYLIILEIINRSSVIFSSIVFYVKPALATLLAYFILDEPITVSITIGLPLILISSVIKMRHVFSKSY